MSAHTDNERSEEGGCRAAPCSRPSVCDKDSKAWTNFIRAAQHLQETLRKPHTLHELIMNDIDHCAQDVRLALDASRYFWRFDLQKKRPGATVLPAPDSSANAKGEAPPRQVKHNLPKTDE